MVAGGGCDIGSNGIRGGRRTADPGTTRLHRPSQQPKLSHTVATLLYTFYPFDLHLGNSTLPLKFSSSFDAKNVLNNYSKQSVLRIMKKRSSRTKTSLYTHESQRYHLVDWPLSVFKMNLYAGISHIIAVRHTPDEYHPAFNKDKKEDV